MVVMMWMKKNERIRLNFACMSERSKRSKGDSVIMMQDDANEHARRRTSTESQTSRCKKQKKIQNKQEI